MKKIIEKYKMHAADKKFIKSIIVAVGLFALSFVINFYAGRYAQKSASNYVTDVILDNISVFDVDWIFIYGPFVLWAFVAILCLMKPHRIPFVLKNIAAFVLIRSVFISLTHIGPFPNAIQIDYSSDLMKKITFGGDLFFSGHTGLPFLMALVFYKNKYLRILFSLTAVFFGIVVLLGHLHYSIDVLSAFFITYTIYRISKKIFKNDEILFESLN